MSKMFFPTRANHSLAGYGEQFGVPKPEQEDFSKLTPSMVVRNVEDVKINVLTYNYMVSTQCLDWDWVEAIEIEQEMSRNQERQEVFGVDADVPLFESIVHEIDIEVDLTDLRLRQVLPKKACVYGVEVKKPFKKDGDHTKAVDRWFSWDYTDLKNFKSRDNKDE